MPHANPRPNNRWTLYQAMTLVGACLVAGVCGGWLLRGTHTPGAGVTLPASEAAPSPSPSQTLGASQLKTAADTQAGPLLQKLQTDPDNPDVLTSLGNLYYDAQQYSAAVDDYSRALESRPSDVAVRTDMATACWYMGDADRALAEFNRVLGDQPNYPNALFNRGVVRWQSKGDAAGALADWELLLATNPDYQARDQVQRLIAQVRDSAGQAAR